MFKRLFSLILCGVMLFCLVACSNNDDKEYDTLFAETPSVFVTEDITEITFYSYYGQGKGSKVPNKHMDDIIQWLASFTIVREATDEDVLDGTNTHYVEIEYSDGTVIKVGLDIVIIDGTRYLLEKDNCPECFWDIISKTNYK